MFKISFFNSTCYLLVKYIIFFSVLAFIGDRFKNAVINNAENSLETFKLTLGYIIYTLFYMFFLILFFCMPLYYVMKIKRGIYFLLLLLIFYWIEFVVYCYFFSPSDRTLGVYNFIIGIFFLNMFFYKQIRIKFS